MASGSLNLNKDREYSDENNVNKEVSENETADANEIDLSIDQLRREFHKSLDLNHPIIDSTSSLDLSKSFDICCEKIETVWPMLATEGKCAMEMEDNEKITNIDLNLSLTPPQVEFNLTDHDESPNQSEISSPSSQLSCMSLDLNVINENLQSPNPPSPSPWPPLPTSPPPTPPSPPPESAEEEAADLPSLILMGCSHCHIYVMVSEAEPRCPKCSTSVLIDIFRESPAKRSRRN